MYYSKLTWESALCLWLTHAYIVYLWSFSVYKWNNQFSYLNCSFKEWGKVVFFFLFVWEFKSLGYHFISRAVISERNGGSRTGKKRYAHLPFVIEAHTTLIEWLYLLCLAIWEKKKLLDVYATIVKLNIGCWTQKVHICYTQETGHTKVANHRPLSVRFGIIHLLMSKTFKSN